MKRSSTIVCFAALLLGALLGILVSGLQVVALDPWLTGADVVIRLWTNALRMLVAPLVTAQIFVAVTAHRADKGEAARLGLLIPAVFLGIQVVIALVTIVATSGLLQLPLFQGLSITGLDAARATVPALPGNEAGGVAWVDQLIPSNLFAAASSDALLPLLIFAMALALATRRLAPELRHHLESAAQGLREALFVIVGWLLQLAPIALFALAFGSASRSGLELGEVMLSFVALSALTLVIAFPVLYLIAVLGGRVPLGRFARAVFPGQVAAAATRSSLATLPALLKESDTTLKLPPTVSALVLPLAGALLKPSRMVNNFAKLLFLTHVLGIQLSLQQVTIFSLVVIALSTAAPGVPAVLGGTRTWPAFVAVGIPSEYVVLLGATIGLIDVGLTVFNSTGYLTANVLVARLLGSRSVPDGVPVPVRVAAAGRSWRLRSRPRTSPDAQADP